MDWKRIHQVSLIFLAFLIIFILFFECLVGVNLLYVRIWFYLVVVVLWLSVWSAFKLFQARPLVRWVGIFLLMVIPLIIPFWEVINLYSNGFPIFYHLRMSMANDKCTVLENYAGEYLFENRPMSCASFEDIIAAWGASCPDAHQLYAAAGYRCNEEKYLRKAISIEDKKFYHILLSRLYKGSKL